MRWTCRISPSSMSAAAMNRRWSADSSTKPTTADRPVVARASSVQARVVEAHRDLGREVLEEIAGEPELGEDEQVHALAAGVVDERVMALEVLLEVAEAGRDLGEADAESLHDAESSAPSLATRRPRAPRCAQMTGGPGGTKGRRAGPPPTRRRRAEGRSAARPDRRGRGLRDARARLDHRPARAPGICSTAPSTSSAKWQATSWPVDRSRSTGSSTMQRSGIAEPLAEPAAGVEPAARRRVHRARDVAGQDDPAAAALDDRDPGSGRPTAAPRSTGGAAAV